MLIGTAVDIVLCTVCSIVLSYTISDVSSGGTDATEGYEQHRTIFHWTRVLQSLTDMSGSPQEVQIYGSPWKSWKSSKEVFVDRFGLRTVSSVRTRLHCVGLQA
jgi:hypothetical protein